MEALASIWPEVDDRVKVIPEDVIESWVRMESGPWDYFREVDLQLAHIALDECHRMVPKDGKGARDYAKKWSDWVGTIRHRGCNVEFLTQDPQKVNRVIDIHAECRIQLVNSEDRRDPYFKVRMG